MHIGNTYSYLGTPNYRAGSLCSMCMYNSPVWKIQKMVKNPCLSIKNMRIGCEKFKKKFGFNWRFP